LEQNGSCSTNDGDEPILAKPYDGHFRKKCSSFFVDNKLTLLDSHDGYFRNK
jgi:hypothetical protein